jgi:hypothetical protein
LPGPPPPHGDTLDTVIRAFLACKNYCFFIQYLRPSLARGTGTLRHGPDAVFAVRAPRMDKGLPFIIAKDDSWKKARKARLD